MRVNYVFGGLFAYGGIIYLLLQLAENRCRNWLAYDTAVIILFLKNALVSFFGYKSLTVQSVVTIANAFLILGILLPECKLGKGFTLKFIFIGISLIPVVFVLSLASLHDCTDKLFLTTAPLFYLIYFLTHVSQLDFNHEKEQTYRMLSAFVLFLVVLTIMFQYTECTSLNIDVLLWICTFRFLLCILFAFAATMDKLERGSEDI